MTRYLKYAVCFTIVFYLVLLVFCGDSYEGQIFVIQETAKYILKPLKIEPEELRTVFNTKEENITIITAYFYLGSFQKGHRDKFHVHTYTKWATTFKYLVNPLVVYTDSDMFLKLISDLRNELPKKTKIRKIKRNELWSFQIVDRIQKIFSLPAYPKHYPNTVLPAYCAAQHSKYAVVADAIKNKYFENEFYAWLDIGYFRNNVNDKQYYQLFAPSTIDRKKLAMNQLWKRNSKLIPSSIFRDNHVWVGGGMFIGTPELLLKYEKLYMRAVNFFLDKQLMNTDQQVLYSLYSEEGRKALNPEIELQLYVPHQSSGNPWFYLGYLCRVVLPTWIRTESYSRAYSLQKTSTGMVNLSLITSTQITLNVPTLRTTVPSIQTKTITNTTKAPTLIKRIIIKNEATHGTTVPSLQTRKIIKTTKDLFTMKGKITLNAPTFRTTVPSTPKKTIINTTKALTTIKRNTTSNAPTHLTTLPSIKTQPIIKILQSKHINTSRSP